jgi:hypothetical protein
MILKFSIIFIYLLIISVIYIFINKRLKYLTDKYTHSIWIPYLHKNYLLIMSIVFFLLVVASTLSIILILTLL